MGSQTQPKLPVVDFTKEDLKPGSSFWLSTCKDVQRAFEEYGCFVAVYDKVTPQLINDVLVVGEDLFDLPKETKVRNVSDTHHFGYIGNYYIPNYESMGIENPTIKENVQTFTNLMWPSGNDHFCETIHTYAKRVSELEQIVSRMIFQSYGVEKHYEAHFDSIHYLFRYMTYTTPVVEEEAAKYDGTPPHTDTSLITILYQNDVSGLEVQTKDGEWFKVEFPPSSFIVMAGDTLLAWSNDRVHAATHRVKVSGDKKRYSVGVFSHSKGIVEVPKELVDDEHPLQFKPFNNFELLKFSLTEEARKAKSIVKAYCGVSPENSPIN